MIKNIEFRNSRGELIKGVLKTKKTSPTLLIVCHGYKSSQHHPSIKAVTDKLYDTGDSTFSFNFSESAQGINLIQQVADLKDILFYFKDYPNKVLFGASFGVVSAAIATPQFSEVKGLITANGFFGSKHLSRYLLREYYLLKLISLVNLFYRKNFKYLQTALQPEKITTTTLVMCARHDEAVSMIQSEEFFKKLKGPKEFYILETADHEITKEPYQQELAEVIDAWLKKNFSKI